MGFGAEQMTQEPPDPQKDALYAWEDTWRYFGERTCTRAQARRFVRKLARIWRVPMPTMRFLRRGVKEWSSMTGPLMVVNYDHCNEAILAHEMAHYVTDSNYDVLTIAAHGPEFVGVYLEMLLEAQVAPRVALEASLRDKGIKWVRETV